MSATNQSHTRQAMITPPTMLQFAKAEVFSRETHLAWQKKLISAVVKNQVAQKRAAKKAAESQAAADKAMERAKKHTKARIAAQAEEVKLAEEGSALREELAKLFPEIAPQPEMGFMPTESSDEPKKAEARKSAAPKKVVSIAEPELWVDEWETEPTEDELYEIHMNYTSNM